MSSRASGAGSRRGPSRGGTRRPGQLSDHDLRAWDAVSRSVTPFSRHRRGAAKPDQPAGNEEDDRQTFLAALGEAGEPKTQKSSAPSRHPKSRDASRQAIQGSTQPPQSEVRQPGRASDQFSGETPASHGKAHGPPSRAPANHPANHPATPSALGALAAGARLDENELRKVRSGRAAISARLDLHGLRQHEAHAALRAFLYRAQSKGAKWALVITGKGSRSRSDNELSDTTWQSDVEHSKGILRTMVPVWLSEPEFRALVVGFRSAGRRHGGEGALYVRLRTRK